LDPTSTGLFTRALLQVQFAGEEEQAKVQAIERGLHWVLSMQSNDGGWAAFDLNNNKEILGEIPFADFMTPLDPTSPDVTAHAIELMAGLNHNGSSLSKALYYLKKKQEDDGAWYGRWGQAQLPRRLGHCLAF